MSTDTSQLARRALFGFIITFMAAGEPGTHLIDLFPGIYQGPPDEKQLLYRMPQLTYAVDHPGNKIPALHFKFEVTQ